MTISGPVVETATAACVANLWSLNAPGPLPDGPYSVSAAQTDVDVFGGRVKAAADEIERFRRRPRLDKRRRPLAKHVEVGGKRSTMNVRNTERPHHTTNLVRCATIPCILWKVLMRCGRVILFVGNLLNGNLCN